MAVVITGNNTPTAGGVTYGDGTTYANTAAGTSGQVLVSNGASAPTWGTASAATTATNLAGGSNGTIPYQSAAGTTQMLAVGTAGQVLQTNGAGPPTWVTPSSGALTLVSTVTASAAATADIETGFDSTYDNYVILFSGLVPVTSGTILRVELKIGGVYRTADYRGAYLGGPAGQSTYTGSQDFFQLSSGGGGLSNLARASNNGEFWVFNPASTTLDKNIKWFFQGFSETTDTAQTTLGSGRYKDTGSTDALTGVRFYMSSGNISGTFRLYGYKNS